MSLKFQRYENPNPGKTLIIELWKPWKDPTKPETAPLPPLESEKGILMPTWTSLSALTVTYFAITAFQHFRIRGL